MIDTNTIIYEKQISLLEADNPLINNYYPKVVYLTRLDYTMFFITTRIWGANWSYTVLCNLQGQTPLLITPIYDLREKYLLERRSFTPLLYRDINLEIMRG